MDIFLIFIGLAAFTVCTGQAIFDYNDHQKHQKDHPVGQSIVQPVQQPMPTPST